MKQVRTWFNVLNQHRCEMSGWKKVKMSNGTLLSSAFISPLTSESKHLLSTKKEYLKRKLDLTKKKQHCLNSDQPTNQSPGSHHERNLIG